MRESGSRQSRDSGCLPFTQNFRNFPDFILENFEMEQMPSICLVLECTRLVPRVSALSPLPQVLFSTSNATHLCRELLCNFLEYVFVAFPTPNKYLLSSHVEIKRHMSASPHRLRLFPGCTGSWKYSVSADEQEGSKATAEKAACKVSVLKI